MMEDARGRRKTNEKNSALSLVFTASMSRIRRLRCMMRERGSSPLYVKNPPRSFPNGEILFF